MPSSGRLWRAACFLLIRSARWATSLVGPEAREEGTGSGPDTEEAGGRGQAKQIPEAGFIGFLWGSFEFWNRARRHELDLTSSTRGRRGGFSASQTRLASRVS